MTYLAVGAHYEDHLSAGVQDGDDVDQIPECGPIPAVVLDDHLFAATCEDTLPILDHATNIG